MTVELKPCPFCGGKAFGTSSGGPRIGAGGTEWVECDNCCASGPPESKPFTGAAWNRRAPDQPETGLAGLRALVERLAKSDENKADAGIYAPDYQEGRAEGYNDAYEEVARDCRQALAAQAPDSPSTDASEGGVR